MTKAEEMLALAERLERLNPDRMVGEKGTTFLYSEDIKAMVEAMRGAAQQPVPRGELPNEEADGKTAIRLLDAWSEIKGAEDFPPYQETMALLGKPNSAGWIWAREVRFERDFDKEQARQRDLAMQCVMEAEARSLDPAYQPQQWPAAKVTNPDIANPTGIPYIDCLIHRVLDAQQDINHAANEGMSQSLCNAAALLDEVETALRTTASSMPSTQQLPDDDCSCGGGDISGHDAMCPYAHSSTHGGSGEKA